MLGVPDVRQAPQDRGDGNFHEQFYSLFFSKSLSRITGLSVSVMLHALWFNLSSSLEMFLKVFVFVGVLFVCFTCFVLGLVLGPA